MTPTMMDYGARGGIANYVNCGILRFSRRSNFGIRAGTRQPPRPHPAASMPSYSMDLIQLIRKVTGKRSLVRDVRQLCPLRPGHIHSVEDPA
jgi:hypothetical protein